MKWGKKLIGLGVAVILGLSLILVPLVSRPSPAQAAVTWTEYQGEVTLDSEKYVVDAWVIRESSTSYKMWYTHGKTDVSVLGIVNDITAILTDNLITDIANLDLEELLNDLGGLDIGTLKALLDGTSTVIGYATSTNGKTWTKVNSEVLAGSGGAWDSVGAPCVIWDGTDNQYKMWYTRLDTDLNQTSLQNYLTDLGGNDATRKAAILNLLGSTRTVIGYATSPYGETWTVQDDEVLPAGGDKLWNSVGAPSVIKDDDETDSQKRYKMWYTRADTDQIQAHLVTVLSEINADTFGLAEIIDIIDGTSSVIGYATSPDGTTWTPGNLNWTPSITALWDSVADPSVVKTGSSYEMWYTNVKTNLLEANLGILLDNIVALGPAALWTTLKDEGLAEFIIDLITLDIDAIKSVLSATSTVIGYATSNDGIIWTPQTAPDLIGSSITPWSSVAAPSVAKTGSSYEMWYTQGFDELTWQNIIYLLDGTNLPIGYASYTAPVDDGPIILRVIPPSTIETSIFGIEGSFLISSEGEILETIEATSEDEDVTITIEAGTIALLEGEPMETLTGAVEPSPPEPPEGTYLIGAYDFGPDGATFDPPITLTWSYDPETLPEDVDLVIAYYDEVNEEWVWVPCEVDTENNIITASVAHFTTFAIITVPLVVVPPAPAAFSVLSLSIQPAEVEPAEVVTIAVLVANTGGESGSYEVTLKIDDVVVATKEVTLAGGASQSVTFTITKDVVGTYSVDVSGLTGSFTVKEEVVPPVPAAFTISSLGVSPSEVAPAEVVTIAVSVANTGGESGSYTVVLKIDGVKEAEERVTIAAGSSQAVSFSVTREEAGTYSVDVNGLTGSFMVKEKVVPPVVPEPIAWWVWLIVGLGVVVIGGLLAYFLWWRRRIA